MKTLNVSDETKQRVKKLKLNTSAKLGKSVSEDDIINILLNKFEERKR